jgi:hypothetical protein
MPEEGGSEAGGGEGEERFLPLRLLLQAKTPPADKRTSGMRLYYLRVTATLKSEASEQQ